MSISRYTLFVLVIFAFFFIFPFFWLRPGEMDLGGDSSRLYFYDPIHYLFSQSMFSVSNSAFGGENLSFFGIPFFLFLFLFKSILHSPTTLISAFHGFSLSVAFLSCYLIVKEFFKGEKEAEGKQRFFIEAASVLAGFFYTLSPIPILWWGYPILTFNQVFVSPLMFFLFLRFFLTQNMRYMIAAILVSVLFAPNFSYIGAPTFFAFYPLATAFLLSYIKFVRHRSIPVKKLAVGVLIFILAHVFHLIPQLVNLFTPGSSAYETVFGDQGKVGRFGYFSAIAPSIKVSYHLLGLQQLTKHEFFSSIFIIFPFVFTLGFLWNKSKTYLLTGIFFLIFLFFVSANITSLGFKLYALAFQLPGFSMFRNFYGQWQWAYLFFYTLLFGQALFIVIMRIKKWQRFTVIGFLAILFVTTSWPFINGTITDTTLWQSKNIKSHVVMDPTYEEVLFYIRSLPVDGKVLSLPLDDHGYQVIKGKNDAAYVGPSTITYLTSKSEFKGFDEFGEFGPTFLDAVRDRNYEALWDIFAMFNIKYIFYNSDPYIYGDNFPSFPYQHVPKFLPPTQEEYRLFIEKLGVKEIKTIAGKYHIYEVDNATYLPHIYAAKRTAYWDGDMVDLHAPLSFYLKDKRLAFYNNSNIKIFNMNKDIFDDIFIKAQNISQIFDFFKIKDFPKFVSPTISQKLSSFIYPLVVLREKRDLAQYAFVNDAYIDRVIYFAEKRINELIKLEDIPVRKNVKSIANLAVTWQNPKLWDFTRYSEYNSWEITLARYYKAMIGLIKKLDKPNQSYYSSITNKVEVKKIVVEHETKLGEAIRHDSSKPIEEKEYIFNLAKDMFADIFSKLNLDLPDDWIIPYDIGNKLEDGIYQVYVNKEDIKNLDITLVINGKTVSPKAMEEGEWVRFEDILVKDRPSLPVAIKINKGPNLVSDTGWKTAEQIKGATLTRAVLEVDKQEDQGGLTTFAIIYSYLGNTSGLIRDISQWKGNSIYAISFDYLTYDQNFLFTLYERGGTKKDRYVNDTYSERLRSKKWKKFSSAFLSLQDAESAFLQISKDQNDIRNEIYTEGIKKIDIRNLSVLRITDFQIPDPRIVFKKVIKTKETSTPQIIFTKVNPTKYKVTVAGVKDPYALVLSERFNEKWKIFFPNKTNEAKTLKGLFSRTLGKIFAAILSSSNIVISSDQSKEELTSYFNNDVVEGMHKNIFLDRNTFETFGYDPIAEKNHLPVNGYANAWYIRPSDVQNKEDYTLIIEMTSQKLFYGSLLVSLGSLLLVVLVSLSSFVRIRK